MTARDGLTKIGGAFPRSPQPSAPTIPSSISTSSETSSSPTISTLPATARTAANGTMPSSRGAIAPSSTPLATPFDHLLAPVEGSPALMPLPTGERKSWERIYQDLATTTTSRSRPDAAALADAAIAARERMDSQPKADRKAIAVMLDKLGQVLQTEMPESGALKDYFTVFETIPLPLLQEAFRRVRNHHRYARFPKIADFLKAIEPELKDHREFYLRLKMIPRLLHL